MEEKKELLLACGIDRIEVLPFDRDFAAMTASDYLALLRERFGATLVVMGYDNRIGSDMKTCAQLSEEGYSSQTVGCADPSHFVGPSLLCCRGWHRFERNTPLPTAPDSPVISSTQIRKALGEGRVEDANAMLGYKYGLYGVVVSGNRMGRTIGFPTANMQLYEPLKLVPANGVYAVEVEVLGRTLKGMCNIGVRPTVDGKVRTIETHILSFDQDIYGLPLRLRFLRRIRDERRFPSLEDLRQQLILDRDACSR